jgi:hypothetical protein
MIVETDLNSEDINLINEVLEEIRQFIKGSIGIFKVIDAVSSSNNHSPKYSETRTSILSYLRKTSTNPMKMMCGVWAVPATAMGTNDELCVGILLWP